MNGSPNISDEGKKNFQLIKNITPPDISYFDLPEACELYLISCGTECRRQRSYRPPKFRFLREHMSNARLLSLLASCMGPESAKSELFWMRQSLRKKYPTIHLANKHLETVVMRRVKGEPLQYILGGFILLNKIK
jgi:hypothetical protein